LGGFAPVSLLMGLYIPMGIYMLTNPITVVMSICMVAEDIEKNIQIFFSIS
jgi:hypothetical protein